MTSIDRRAVRTAPQRAGNDKGQLQAFDGVKLLEHRTARGLSAADLADLLGVAASSIWRWERGTQHPNPRSAKRIAELFGVPLRTLTALREDEIGLVELRLLAGMVIADAAKEFKVSRNTLTAIETGHRPPGRLDCELARAYGVSVDRIRELWTHARATRMHELHSRLAGMRGVAGVAAPDLGAA